MSAQARQVRQEGVRSRALVAADFLESLGHVEHAMAVRALARSNHSTRAALQATQIEHLRERFRAGGRMGR